MGISVILDDPQPAALVDRERDRLVNRRLAGKRRDAETCGQCHRLRGFFRREAFGGGNGEVAVLREAKG